MRSLLAVVFIALSGLLNASDFNPPAIWMNGFIYLQGGQRAEDSGDRDAALREYHASLDTYYQLGEYFPDFLRERRRQRVTLLISKIASMSGNLEIDPAEVVFTGVEAVEVSGATVPEPPAIWKREMKNGEAVFTLPLVRTPETRAYHRKVQPLLDGSPVRNFKIPLSGQR